MSVNEYKLADGSGRNIKTFPWSSTEQRCREENSSDEQCFVHSHYCCWPVESKSRDLKPGQTNRLLDQRRSSKSETLQYENGRNRRATKFAVLCAARLDKFVQYFRSQLRSMTLYPWGRRGLWVCILYLRVKQAGQCRQTSRLELRPVKLPAAKQPYWSVGNISRESLFLVYMRLLAPSLAQKQ